MSLLISVNEQRFKDEGGRVKASEEEDEGEPIIGKPCSTVAGETGGLRLWKEADVVSGLRKGHFP